MKKRILSAIIMLVIFIPLIIIGNSPYAVFIALLAMLGLYELIKIRESKKQFPFLIKVIAYLLTAFFCLSNYQSNVLTYTVDYRVMAFLIFAFLLPMIFIDDNRRYNLNDALFIIGSCLFIGLSFNLLILIRNYSLSYTIYLFLITTITDTFAFLFGKYIGKRPLAEKISPKKTVEGLIGGTIMGTFVASIFYITVMNNNISYFNIIGVTALLSLIGQLGDLVFSFIKRYYDKKDFSNLIPGHGGILDRMDSIIFVVLAFVLTMIMI